MEKQQTKTEQKMEVDSTTPSAANVDQGAKNNTQFILDQISNVLKKSNN